VDLLTPAGARVTLRPASPADEQFLQDLYADRRRPEVAGLGWPEAVVAGFLDQQFRAQRDGYRTDFPAAEDMIVVEDGTPVGRLLVDRTPDGYRVVDVTVCSRCRGRGIGTALMRSVLGEAAGAGVPVRLTARRSDRRLVGWYAALGFEVVGHDDVHVSMVSGG
jgi:ribosomal protein S18 acetylase RimI-like enzyme